MLFQVNPNDPVPIYRQLVRQVRDAVASGRLQPGDKLPSQRKLSLQLVINHLTVKKAYETLEADGLVYTDRGRGTFVRDSFSKGDLRRKGMSDLERRLGDTASMARLLGLNQAEFIEKAKRSWREGKKR